MANRTLASHDDGTLTEQRDGELGYDGAHSTLRIERSAAGRPGLLFIIEDHHGGGLSGETCVSIEDGNAFLAPVLEWLNESRRNNPEGATK